MNSDLRARIQRARLTVAEAQRRLEWAKSFYRQGKIVMPAKRAANVRYRYDGTVKPDPIVNLVRSLHNNGVRRRLAKQAKKQAA